MTKTLTCDHLIRDLDRFTLGELSFSLESGYLTGLIGRNGAGKTTLMKILAGVDLHFRGEVEIMGISLKENPVAVKKLVGYVSETIQPFWEKTAMENGQLLGPYYPAYEDSCLKYWLDRMEVKPDVPVHEFSKGTLMKFFCCMALSHKPKILLLDEPTSGFDPVFRREFLYILQELLEQDMTIFMSSHLTEDLDKIADVILRLEEGKLAGQETIEQFREKHPHGRLGDAIEGGIHIHDLLK